MSTQHKPIVQLSDHITQLDMPAEDRARAIVDAHWVTASPVEWEWTPDQQANMARYILWATQRLAVIAQLVTGEPLLRKKT